MEAPAQILTATEGKMLEKKAHEKCNTTEAGHECVRDVPKENVIVI